MVGDLIVSDLPTAGWTLVSAKSARLKVKAQYNRAKRHESAGNDNQDRVELKKEVSERKKISESPRAACEHDQAAFMAEPSIAAVFTIHKKIIHRFPGQTRADEPHMEHSGMIPAVISRSPVVDALL